MKLNKLLIITLILFFIIIGLIRKPNGDIWWHLKTGEYIIKNYTIPDTDIFSYTAVGNKWIVHSWLSEVLYYIIYNQTGNKGLILLRILITLSIALLLIRLSFQNSKQNYYFLITFYMTLFGLACWTNLILRPFLFYYIFVLIYIAILFKYRYNRNSTGKLCFIPVLQLLWANIHTSYTVGLFILFLFIISELIHHYWQNRKIKIQLLKPLITVFIITFLVSLMNPNTYKSLLYVTQSNIYAQYVNEWQSPFSTYFIDSYMTWFYLIYFLISLLILILYIKFFKTPDFFGILLWTCFGYLSYRYQRHNTIFFVTTIPFIYRYSSKLLAFIIIRYKKIEDYFPWFNTTGFILLLTLSVYIGCNGIKQKPDGVQYNINWNKIGYNIPQNGVDFIINHNIKGRIWNSYDFGGYLIYRYYPDRKVFFDGRGDPYGPELYEQFFNPTIDSLDMMFQKYNITCCIVKYGESLGFYQYLITRDYVLVYFDDICMVIVRYADPNKDFVQSYGYRYIHPVLHDLTPVNKQTLPLLKSEWNRALKINPDMELAQERIELLNTIN